MGASIKYVGDRRRMAVLRRAIWSVIESGLPGEFDIDAADDAVSQLCKAVSTVAEDMKTVSEMNKIGYIKRHWYVLELNISDSSIAMQNTLEGAGQCPPFFPISTPPHAKSNHLMDDVTSPTCKRRGLPLHYAITASAKDVFYRFSVLQVRLQHALAF
ncbi:MAG: hypothetical protein M1569_02830 [Candidatus Marsarchaeota archaeon]|nr:hypothetical protein [Candidatus Marsarchaeota archaeon]MCL5413312.1 hypothetical protein [Candidatus Marsarchaeota archaeon]